MRPRALTHSQHSQRSHASTSQLHTLSLMRHVQSPKNIQPFISAPIQGYVYVLKCSGPLFSISLLLRVAAASKSLSNAQIQGLFLLPSRIGMYKSTYPPSLNYTVPRRVSVLKGALKAPAPPLPGECRTPETRPRTSRRMRATPSRNALRTQVPESPTECSSLAKE